MDVAEEIFSPLRFMFDQHHRVCVGDRAYFIAAHHPITKSPARREETNSTGTLEKTCARDWSLTRQRPYNYSLGVNMPSLAFT